MNGFFHELVAEALRQLPRERAADLILKKVSAQGINLSRRELKRVRAHILNGRSTFRTRSWKFWGRRQFDLEITEAEIRQIESDLKSLTDKPAVDLIDRITDDLSDHLLSTLNRRWPTEARLQNDSTRGFRKRLLQRWNIPLGKLQMLLTIAREVGSTIEVEQKNDSGSSPYLCDVLSRIHARACQTTDEIICLLQAGFADGAMARWRTLHEIAVVALFISENGEGLAERYSLHQAIEAERAASEYERCQGRLGYEPLDPLEKEKVRSAREALIARFGKSFGGHYGWAAEHLKISQPTFVEIERAVEIDHFRAFTAWQVTLSMQTLKVSISSSAFSMRATYS